MSEDKGFSWSEAKFEEHEKRIVKLEQELDSLKNKRFNQYGKEIE